MAQPKARTDAALEPPIRGRIALWEGRQNITATVTTAITTEEHSQGKRRGAD